MKNTKQHHRFILPPVGSPTFVNLRKQLLKRGWIETDCANSSQFDERNFEFDPTAAQTLEFKHLLANLNNQYSLNILPTTLTINDQNWPDVLTKLKLLAPSIWILKPSMLNNGQHIKIFTSLAAIEQHYSQTKRMGGEHVLQQYITNPHLLKGPADGHKYSIRMFVVLSNYAGAYLYPEGYFNIALHPYQANNFNDLKAHLTNEHLRQNTLNVIQIPTSNYALFKPFYPQIKAILRTLIQALHRHHPPAFTSQERKKLALFGFDFMLDAEEKLYLLEANHAPCFPTDDEHPLYEKLYTPFWHALVEQFIIPIANNECSINQADFAFEKLC